MDTPDPLPPPGEDVRVRGRVADPRDKVGAATRQGRAPPGQDGAADAERLLEELRIHQVELELQNDELKATRHALEDSLRRYSGLFDFAPIGYAVLDAGGNIRELNRVAADLLGVVRGEAVGRRFEARVAAADTAAFRPFLAAVLTAGGDRVGPVELQLASAAGGPRVVRLTGACPHGDPPVALVAVEDVTARRRAEDEVRESLRRRDEFLGVLSHELRNPLAPIRNALELLRRSPAPGEAAARAIAVIDRQSAHLTRIVDDLLDVTRIARGKVHLRREVLDLRALARRTLEDHRDAFERAGVALDEQLAGEPCWVDADATRLAQVLGNLLGNALKFTPRGGRVEVTVQAGEDAARLAVRDSGAGIEPELQSHLFEPFSQGSQALARAAGGLGLGLATVKGLVELHGGTVAIASGGAGRGTEVAVTLPRTGAAPAPRPPAAAAPVRRRILVVEDNVDGALTLKELLEACGHEVHVAHDGPGGLQSAREHLPDVVLCDLGLPGMDGFAVARAIRADPVLKGTHLVALSGYARPEDVRRSREAGFDHHVAKPPPLAELTALLAAPPARRG